MATPTIIVTGANRGIGQALCHKILSDPNLTSSGPFRLLATSRKGEDLGFQPSTREVKVQYPKLDISDSSSVKALADSCERGSVRVLVNNAGVNLDNAYGVENAKKTLQVNYRGTLDVSMRNILSQPPDPHSCADASADVPKVHPAPGASRTHREPFLRGLQSKRLQREHTTALPESRRHRKRPGQAIGRVPRTFPFSMSFATLTPTLTPFIHLTVHQTTPL